MSGAQSSEQRPYPAQTLREGWQLRRCRARRGCIGEAAHCEIDVQPVASEERLYDATLPTPLDDASRLVREDTISHFVERVSPQACEVSPPEASPVRTDQLELPRRLVWPQQMRQSPTVPQASLQR